VHAQHHRARVPPGEQVHAAGEQKREQHAALTAEQIAAGHEYRGQRREE
jgi:hypothetical protein